MVIHKKTAFEKRIEGLHDSAERIAGGLKGVLETLNGIAKDNTVFLNGQSNGGKDNVYTGDIMGAISAIRDQIEEITKLSDEFAENISHHGNEIIDLNKQLEDTKKDAMLDPLTGVANRRKFEQVLGELLGNIDELKGALSVLMSDVDNFKDFNDKLGHHVGDQVLKLVAKAFVYNLKSSDFVGRWGGDEFAAILPGTSLNDAHNVSERVRSMLSNKNIQDKESGKSLGKVTVSIGVTSYQEGDDLKKIVGRADKAMYEAKHSGKNKVVADKPNS